jgi:membrane peptidoglycan carboxypeptidase
MFATRSARKSSPIRQNSQGKSFRERRRVELLLQGNAKPGKHISDARHLFEAGKYGGGYFVTNDQRILDKRVELADALPPSLNIVTLKQLLDIFDDYQSGRRV